MVVGPSGSVRGHGLPRGGAEAVWCVPGGARTLSCAVSGGLVPAGAASHSSRGVGGIAPGGWG